MPKNALFEWPNIFRVDKKAAKTLCTNLSINRFCTLLLASATNIFLVNDKTQTDFPGARATVVFQFLTSSILFHFFYD